MIKNGEFREDLYYRLNVVSINIPPLRERKGDVELLAKFLIDKISSMEKIEVKGISNKALEYLKRYDWPGNVRELQNIIERAINFLGEDKLIEPKHLPSKITDGVENYKIGPLKDLVEDREKRFIVEALINAKGNKSLAAEMLEISRTSLYEKINKYKIEI